MGRLHVVATPEEVLAEVEKEFTQQLVPVWQKEERG
jgi:hypothetical protein